MYLLRHFIKASSTFEKKWLASDTISNSTLIPFWALNLLFNSLISSKGTNSSFLPCITRPEVGHGDKNEKSCSNNSCS